MGPNGGFPMIDSDDIDLLEAECNREAASWKAHLDVCNPFECPGGHQGGFAVPVAEYLLRDLLQIARLAERSVDVLRHGDPDHQQSLANDIEATYCKQENP
jgi:hypothetical protein